MLQAQVEQFSPELPTPRSRPRSPPPRNNVFAGESGVPDCSGTVQGASAYYAYTLDSPDAVKAIVTAGAGVGRV